MRSACQIEILLTSEPLQVAEIEAKLVDPDCGARMVFQGCTRRRTGEKVTTLLAYEAYPSMAEKELRKLAEQAADRWPLLHLVIAHRLGQVDVTQPSVIIGASSAHRVAVMESIPWIMDRLKTDVPIWKREHYEDGKTEWVHPSDKTN